MLKDFNEITKHIFCRRISRRTERGLICMPRTCSVPVPSSGDVAPGRGSQNSTWHGSDYCILQPSEIPTQLQSDRSPKAIPKYVFRTLWDMRFSTGCVWRLQLFVTWRQVVWETGTNFRNEIAASVFSFENGGRKFLGKFGGSCPLAYNTFQHPWLHKAETFFKIL